jgi:hypothetical protein
MGTIVGCQIDPFESGYAIHLDRRTNPDGQLSPAGHILAIHPNGNLQSDSAELDIQIAWLEGASLTPSEQSSAGTPGAPVSTTAALASRTDDTTPVPADPSIAQRITVPAAPHVPALSFMSLLHGVRSEARHVFDVEVIDGPTATSLLSQTTGETDVWAITGMI